MKNCNKSVFFESRKKKDLYMWVGNVPHGPSAKFLVESGKIIFLFTTTLRILRVVKLRYQTFSFKKITLYKRLKLSIYLLK